MKIYKYPVIIVLIVLIIGSCGQNKKENDRVVQKVSVEIESVYYDDITVTRTYSGTLEGTKQSKIYATIPERVVDIPVSEGSYVKKGVPVVVLDKSGATSQYNQAYAVYQNAKDNYEKMQRLYDQKAISEMSFKTAKTQYEVARANFEAARATVVLSSPIDGIVTEISVNLGQQVPLGQPIATIAKTGKMRLTIYVGLNQVEKLTVGKRADVFTDSDEPIKAVIVESSRSADPQTRLFRIELEMDNPNNNLKPGMYARAKVVIDHLENVLTINNRALFSEEGIAKVYFIQDGIAHMKTIVTGAADDNRTQVISGLEEGQQVVIVGKSSLRDGSPIMISDKDTQNVSG